LTFNPNLVGAVMNFQNSFHFRYDINTSSYVEMTELEFVVYLRPLLISKIQILDIPLKSKDVKTLAQYTTYKLIEICMLSGMTSEEVLHNPDWFNVIDDKGVGWSFAHSDFKNPSQGVLMAFARKILEIFNQPLSEQVAQKSRIQTPIELYNYDFGVELPSDLFFTIRSLVKLPIYISNFKRPDRTCFLYVYYSDSLRDFTTEVIWYCTIEYAKLRAKMLASAQ
jgi:hypothetical protein